MSTRNANKEDNVLKSTCYLGILGVFGLLLMAGACGNSSVPTSPIGPPGAVALQIIVTASSDTLLVGTTEIFKATAKASDGTVSQITSGTWHSTEPDVATVEASTGRVTIVGTGYACIGVEYLGNRGDLWIRGVDK
jgi:hypothetical protein